MQTREGIMGTGETTNMATRWGHKILVGIARSGLVLAKGLFALLLLVMFLLGYGISGQDAEAYREFSKAVERWQVNPDFRKIAAEYVQLSNRSLQSHPFFVNAPDLVMALRSLPGLPPEIAVTDTSRDHYDNFANGELAAYVHLSAEQGLASSVGMIESLGAKAIAEGRLSDESAEWFLNSFNIKPAIVTDQGALDSVRRLLADTEAGKAPFVHRGLKAPPYRVRPAGLFGAVCERLPEHSRLAHTRLQPYIERIAAREGIQTSDVLKMSAAEQQKVYARLDAELKSSDFELWRIKQVNDFLSGMWAQAYGQPYNKALVVAIGLRTPCRIIFPVIVLTLVGLVIQRHIQRKQAEAAVPIPATEGGPTPPIDSD